mmetsp:Transcript_62224/g.140058  ORF Transcript_62224/g.140058 Transcript_62224/m.140058 type:complete len:226 (+) Transcript_62224:236-913(+)
MHVNVVTCLRIDLQGLQDSVAVPAERPESRLLGQGALQLREVIDQRLDALQQCPLHPQSPCPPPVSAQLLVVPGAPEGRGTLRVVKVQESVTRVQTILLVPGAEVEIHLAAHLFVQVLQHHQQRALGEVRRHVVDHERGHPRRVSGSGCRSGRGLLGILLLTCLGSLLRTATGVPGVGAAGTGGVGAAARCTAAAVTRAPHRGARVLAPRNLGGARPGSPRQGVS